MTISIQYQARNPHFLKVYFSESQQVMTDCGPFSHIIITDKTALMRPILCISVCLVCCLINRIIFTPSFFTVLSQCLCPLSFSLGWDTFGHKIPIWPTGHVVMLNQRPGDGHMAAKSVETQPEAES